MTVTGPGGTNTCQTTSYNYVAPAPYVSLSQIPYTGFDFGPLGNALYWLSLLSFAVAGGYLLVYYKGGAMTIATVLAARKSVASVASAPAKIVEATAKKIDAVIQPVLSPIQNVSVAGNRFATTDAMVLTHSKDGSAPRIVISRN